MSGAMMRQSPNLFDFWRRLKRGNVHPDDRHVLARAIPAGTFDLSLVPHPIAGPLRTAPIVVCYVNPGVNEPEDFLIAASRALRRKTLNQLQGKDTWPHRYEAATNWIKPRLGPLWRHLDQCALFNAVPYHSSGFNGPQMHASFYLPSVMAARAHLHQVLVPDAIAGRRVVIVARSAWLWGVHHDATPKGVFVVRNRGGHIGWREDIVGAVERLMRRLRK
jgi:hypothetical protein